MSLESIGVAGLGIMGGAMARNLAKVGFKLRVWNRSHDKAEPFQNEGYPVAGSPEMLAEAVEAVVVMVSDPDAMLEVVDGPQGIARADLKGKVVINCSTVSPEATERAAEAVVKAGGDFLDAPVSGTKKPAEDGTLVFLVGGEEPVIERCRFAFQTMGSEVVHCGGIGAGTRMKLAVNLLLMTCMQGLSEAMLAARAMGLEETAFLQAIGGGALAAPMFQVKGKSILAGNWDKQFPLRHAFKDLNLLMAEMGGHGLALPATARITPKRELQFSEVVGRAMLGASKSNSGASLPDKKPPSTVPPCFA